MSQLILSSNKIIRQIVQKMSSLNEQPSLLASCNSQEELRYLEVVVKNSAAKTPLKEISGIYEDNENPESSFQSQIILKKQGHSVNNDQKKSSKVRSEIFEQLMSLKHQICIIKFKNKQTKTQISLNGSQSFFACLTPTSHLLQCSYKFRGQSTFEIYINKHEGGEQQLVYNINFDTVTARLTSQRQDKEYCFEQNAMKYRINTGKYQLVFSTDIQEGDYLKKRLEKMHQNSLGNKLKLSQLQSIPSYFKQRYDTQEYFVNNCETGDILLFQDNHFMAKLQRFITGSDFNHVGMIVKDSHYGVLIFQSNSNSGVCLTMWKSLVSNGWYHNIPKITWRRLTKVTKNNAFRNTIRRFLMQNLKKSFDISSRVITANESVIIPAEEDTNNAGQTSGGFFCSELIATVYKNLGLLTRDRGSPNYQPACKFYPKDFSQGSGRKLDQGELSPQIQVFFNSKLLQRNYPQHFNASSQISNQQ